MTHSIVITPCVPSAPFFFFNDTATTEIYTLSLHDALPISSGFYQPDEHLHPADCRAGRDELQDRKSTRLNSSHSQISYAVFCLKKKKQHTRHTAFQIRTTVPYRQPRHLAPLCMPTT